MIHQHSSDIIQNHQIITLANGEYAETLTFHNDLILVLSEKTIAMFKDLKSVTDPLGNGLIASVQLNKQDHLPNNGSKIIERYQSGFVGLTDGRAMLVTPNVIQLFPTPNDALRNQNEVCRLTLA